MTDTQLKPVNEEVARRRVDFLTSVNVWAPEMLNASETWLDNFNGDNDRRHALNLLHCFLYFNADAMSRLFYAAFQSVSCEVVDVNEDFDEAMARWRAYVEGVVITYVEGEVPNATDSGRVYARRARTILGLAQAQVLDPSAALRRLHEVGASAVVLVDDFLGSGEQLVRTWQRSYAGHSFATEAAREVFDSWYCPALATSQGITRVEAECVPLRVMAGSTLRPDSSVVSPTSRAWPHEMRATGPEFIERVSTAFGATESNGGVNDPKGFQHLGLNLAFEDTIPDATIPMMRWEENGWNPLRRKP